MLPTPFTSFWMCFRRLHYCTEACSPTGGTKHSWRRQRAHRSSTNRRAFICLESLCPVFVLSGSPDLFHRRDTNSELIAISTFKTGLPPKVTARYSAPPRCLTCMCSCFQQSFINKTLRFKYFTDNWWLLFTDPSHCNRICFIWSLVKVESWHSWFHKIKLN